LRLRLGQQSRRRVEIDGSADDLNLRAREKLLQPAPRERRCGDDKDANHAATPLRIGVVPSCTVTRRTRAQAPRRNSSPNVRDPSRGNARDKSSSTENGLSSAPSKISPGRSDACAAGLPGST